MKKKGHYDFGELPWDEFMEVLKGNGPCNKKEITDQSKKPSRKIFG